MPSALPDLLIRTYASAAQLKEVRIGGRSNVAREDYVPSVYDASTIVLDFIDARTNALVWRGWANDSLAALIDNQEAMEEDIDQAVARILERLPRRD